MIPIPPSIPGLAVAAAVFALVVRLSVYRDLRRSCEHIIAAGVIALVLYACQIFGVFGLLVGPVRMGNLLWVPLAIELTAWSPVILASRDLHRIWRAGMDVAEACDRLTWACWLAFVGGMLGVIAFFDIVFGTIGV